MNFVYLAFGENLITYKQVCFSIYTVLNIKQEQDKIVVVTDHKAYFDHIREFVEFIDLTPELINQWQKGNNGFFRIKIKAIEAASIKYPLDDLLYLDADTFIFKDLTQIRSELALGQNFMHLKELKLSAFVTQSQKEMWEALKDKEFDGVYIDDNSYMWNAGAVALSKDSLTYLQQVVRVNDQMCQHLTKRYFVEQFAFSVVLANMGVIKPLDSYIGHYWGNKPKWNQVINDFMIRCYLENYSVAQTLLQVSNMNLEDYPIRGYKANV
ncbi:hypothetical protein [Myroides sp. LJL119]